MLPVITSLQNEKIKNLVKLRRRGQRDRQRLMLIDGERALRLALKNAYPVVTIYFDKQAAQADLLLTARQQSIGLQPVTSEVFAKIRFGNALDPFVGLAPQPDFALANLPRLPRPLYLIAEGLEKPGNLGAILRSADAAGLNGLLLCDCNTDICNPNVVQASRGALFSVPLAQTGSLEAIRWLRAQSVQVLAAVPRAVRSYTQYDMTGPIAIAIGAEHSGLSDIWMSQTLINIPMKGQVDSLNVAQAASILIFEALRQRTLK